MRADASSYISADLQSRFRSQAYRVWFVTSVVLLFWISLIVAAPIFHLGGVYTFFSYICHQIPDRSFHIAGEQFAVCSRCFGVYFGIVLGFLLYPLWRPIDAIDPISRAWLFLSLIPIAIDWSLTFFGIWENTQASRFSTGLIHGCACAVFIVPAIVEIKRNLTRGA